MELFFMMTAMLALLGPIAVGRVRCIRITPRLLDLVNCILPTASHSESGARPARGRAYAVVSDSVAGLGRERRFKQQRPAHYLARLPRLTPFWSHSTL